MEKTPQLSLETYREAAELRRIGNRAVHKAQEENRRRGIANTYSYGGQIYFELPDGTLTREDPTHQHGQTLPEQSYSEEDE